MSNLRLPRIKMPKIDANGDEVLDKNGNPVFGGDSKTGGIRFDGFDDLKANMESLLPGTVAQVSERMKLQAKPILEAARNKTYAQRQWKDHPDRHRGGSFASVAGARRAGRELGRWPHNKTAKEGLFTYVRARKTFVELGLAHNPETLYRTDHGALINYGAVLETGFGGRFAVIAPTLAANHRKVIASLQNALAIEQTFHRESSGGHGTVNKGWVNS